MTIKNYIFLGIFVASFTVFHATGAASVDTEIGRVLSLDECIGIAMTNNPELQGGEQKVRSKTAALHFARAQRMPTLSLSETASRTNNPVMSFMSILNQERFTNAHMASINEPGAVENFNTKLSFQLPIYNGRKVSNGIRMADLDLDATSLELERKKQEIRYKVVEAYLKVLLAEEHLKVTSDAFRTSEAHVKMAGSHFDAGTVVKSDLLSAEVRFAHIKEMRLSARNNVELAKANLLFTMGEPQGADIRVNSSPLEFKPVEKELSELIKTALENRAELKQLDNYVALKIRMADSATASKRPSLNLMAEYNMDNSDFIDSNGESWFAGVNVSINIFDGNRSRYSARKSRHEALETGLKTEALKQGIELQVRQAFLELKTAGEKIGVTSQAVEQAKEALRIVENRYKSGLMTIFEVLESETSLTEARMRHVSSLHDYSVGLEKLWFAAGVNNRL